MRGHTYSTDNAYRVRIIAGLAVLAWLLGSYIPEILGIIAGAIGLAAETSQVVAFFRTPFTNLGIDPEAWVPTTGVIFTLLFASFNHWGWRNRWIQKTPFVSVPDLNDNWEVVVDQTDAEGNVGKQRSVGTVKISQTWRKISIAGDFENSKSWSLNSSFTTDTSETRLEYFYRNEPDPHAPDEANIHYGQAYLYYNSEVETLIGEYFTDRNRRTAGELKLVRVQD